MTCFREVPSTNLVVPSTVLADIFVIFVSNVRLISASLSTLEPIELFVSNMPLCRIIVRGVGKIAKSNFSFVMSVCRLPLDEIS
jgi:hypothetical protein